MKRLDLKNIHLFVYLVMVLWSTICTCTGGSSCLASANLSTFTFSDAFKLKVKERADILGNHPDLQNVTILWSLPIGCDFSGFFVEMRGYIVELVSCEFSCNIVLEYLLESLSNM